ncbi:MAG: hypothetical protein J6X55_12160 [Victivallales bacterium]|nr:hypothetical protein [Victivallales bacterium]
MKELNCDECPLIPMAAITGTPSREFLYERLKNWRSCGVTQFMIYARSGMETEYMSEEWLDRCEWICEDASSLGFTSIWLYDEKNWPSGTCNGEVLKKNPNYAIQALCVSEPKPGEYVFSLQRGSQMADLFNPDAVDSFIHLTHEKYEKRLSRFFGKLIKGFFSDEPDIAFFRGLPEENYIKVLPYYNGLEEEYRQLTGGNLRDDILRGLIIGSDFWQGPFNRLVGKKFRTSFSERLSRWSAERGMVQTGHLMNEYSSNLALRCNGHILEVLNGFSFPGIDDIHTPLDNDQMEYLTYSSGMYAIEKHGNQGGMAELFAMGPCDMTLEWMCAHFFFCAAFGINRYLLAVSQTEMRGNVEKPWYFNPFNESQPWFDAFRELGECASEAARWARKERICDIAVRYPYEPQPLTDLLRHLADAQFNWKLILPDETTDAPVVLSCVDGGIKEERSATFFYDFGMLNQKMLCNFPRKMEVCELDGSLAHGIFLRVFHDNSAMVINLSGKERKLCLKAGEKTIPFSLSPIGFYTWKPAEKAEKTEETIFDLPQFGWEIKLDSPNAIRVEFEDEKFEFTLADDLQQLRLVLRNYGDPVKVLLDGREIDVSSPCCSLTQGFRELYRESTNLRLSKGKHLLTLCEKAADYPFLPTAFLVGDFSADKNKTLLPYRNDGIGLSGYVGKIRLKQELEIPSGTTLIQANTLKLPAELSINGTSLGRRIRHPFCWEISEYSGKANIELTIMTSCGRYFGEKIFFPDASCVFGKWLRNYRPRNDKPLLFYSTLCSK